MLCFCSGSLLEGAISGTFQRHFSVTAVGKNADPTNQPSVSGQPVMLILWCRARILASRIYHRHERVSLPAARKRSSQTKNDNRSEATRHFAFCLSPFAFRLSHFAFRLSVALRAGEPPARVPHAETVHRTVSPPLLRFLILWLSPAAAGDQRRCLWKLPAF